MGQVVPFTTRVRDSGDWSTSERARLEDLADQLGAAGVDVEVIFGATDEGDPWCVVTDANGDVLIHVARIDGTFVVHSAVDDALSEGADLHATLHERLAATEDAVAPRTATILPFEPRQAQTLLALVVAAAFFYETAGLSGEARAAELPAAPLVPDEPPPPVPNEADPHSQEREVTVRAAALQEDVPAAPALPAETPAPAAIRADDAPALPSRAEVAPPEPAASAPSLPDAVPAEAAPVIVVQGTAGDDSLAGTAANEHVLGGAGNDTLQGGGGQDTLDGGAGDDRIEVAPGVVAIGGDGADTFVLHAHGPGVGPPPDGFFGVLLDFAGAQGDRVVNSFGTAVRLNPHPTGGQPGGDHTLTGPPGFTGPLTRVEVDLDGDGVTDGYLLVGGRGPPPPMPPGDHADPPITVTGQSLPLDLLG